VRKGCDGKPEIAIFTSVLGDSVSCERVAFRAVSLALPRAFKREIEKKEKQERMSRCEDVKMRRCEDEKKRRWRGQERM